MRDGPIRTFIKSKFARRYLTRLDEHRHKLRRAGQEHWVLGGECRSCASCCEEPTIVVGAFMYFFVPATLLWLWWQRVVNGFVLSARVREARAFVFCCTHFDRETRRCDSYGSRPGICHDYPRMLLEATDPEFFPSCGHRAVAKNGAAMLQALKGRGVEGEQLVQITRKLRLE